MLAPATNTLVRITGRIVRSPSFSSTRAEEGAPITGIGRGLDGLAFATDGSVRVVNERNQLIHIRPS